MFFDVVVVYFLSDDEVFLCYELKMIVIEILILKFVFGKGSGCEF